MGYKTDYEKYSPELVPMVMLGESVSALVKANTAIMKSKVLLKLGKLGLAIMAGMAFLALVGTGIYWWIFWKTQEKKDLIDRQLYEQRQGNEDENAVNEDLP